MKKKETFYITTPLYYPSGNWHLGHAYTTTCCDTIARYKRLSGYDVFFLTGTDEHGQKINERANKAGKTPKEFVDELVADIKRLWSLMDISYDKFIRTTDDYHVKSVQKIFEKLYEQGDIYKSSYKGKYCTPCESFWTESQLVDGKCPDCGREVIDSEEECYFFRLSKYADRLRDLLLNGDFLEPKSRVNEMVHNFIDEGLSDLAVSRTSVKWGIPVSFDPKHTIYVWIDALANYINALGYNSDDESMMQKYWPANVHMAGKEIVSFHSIIWPAILMALGLPVTKKVYGHGWLLLSGDKMSKSKGNVADPFVLAERYGVDALRYYLLREIPFGSDGAYTDEAFLLRYNSDLVNDLGNLVKRTIAMSRQYFGGKVTASKKASLGQYADLLKEKTDNAIDSLSCSKALEEIFDTVGRANKFIDETKPWQLFKEGKTEELNEVLYNLLETIRICGSLLTPFLTKGGETIFEELGLDKPQNFDNLYFGAIKEYATGEDKVLYARVDVKKELKFLAGDVMEEEKKEVKAEKKPEPKKEEPKKEEKAEEVGYVTIDEFFKTQLKIAEVIACEKVEKTEKLLKLTVKLGDEIRTVVSGIAKSYTPEEMVGKQVVLVANLKPAKLRGIESCGMVLCASDGDKIVLVSPEVKVPSGVEVG